MLTIAFFRDKMQIIKAKEIIMKSRKINLPENLLNFDLSQLEYVDGWAYATTVFSKEQGANVFFVSEDEEEVNLCCEDKFIRVKPYIILRVSAEYAKEHEQTFKAGIKETAQQLALDGYFEKALQVIPTNFYVFDKKFMDLFTIFYYKKSLRQSNLPEERQQQLEDLRISTKEKQLTLWQEYDKNLSRIRNPEKVF